MGSGVSEFGSGVFVVGLGWLGGETGEEKTASQ